MNRFVACLVAAAVVSLLWANLSSFTNSLRAAVLQERLDKIVLSQSESTTTPSDVGESHPSSSSFASLLGNRNAHPDEDRALLRRLTQSPPPGSLRCPPGLTPIYDRVVDATGTVVNHGGTNTTTSNTTTDHNSTIPQRIPKILHLSYKNRCVPPEIFGNGIQRWKDELPDYSVYFHDDAAVRRLLHATAWPEFPHLASMLRCIHYRGAMTIDVWRMLVLYRFGGLYADIDNVPAVEFQGGRALLPDDSFFASSDGWFRPNQNVFAMEPYHPIAVFTIQVILRNLLDMPSIRRPKVVFTTGPDALKTGYLMYLSGRNSWSEREEKAWLFNDRGVFPNKGFLGRQIHKESNWNWLHPQAGEQVQYDNQTITKKERDHRLMGLYHWSKVVYWNRHGKDYSCREYLYRLDHPNSNASNAPATNWTVAINGVSSTR